MDESAGSTRRALLNGTLAGAAPTALPAPIAGFLGEADMVWQRMPRTWHEDPFPGNGFLVTAPHVNTTTHAPARTSPAVAPAAVDLWRDVNHLRPKWGIYRRTESSGLRDCYQPIRNYQAHQLV